MPAGRLQRPPDRGRDGAEHLLERGFTSFAFFGYPQFTWSQDCRHGFAAAVAGRRILVPRV